MRQLTKLHFAEFTSTLLGRLESGLKGSSTLSSDPKLNDRAREYFRLQAEEYEKCILETRDLIETILKSDNGNAIELESGDGL